jgi:tetratricopeptide (TPR) repeat protein
MKTKETVMGIVMILIIAGGFFGLRAYQKTKSRNDLATRILEVGARSEVTPSSIEELRIAIAAYEKQIEEHVKDAAQTGVYWKILATRLQDKGLHIEALDALERALHYYPQDEALHYQTGISAGFAAKDSQNFSGNVEALRSQYYALSESGFLRAIELDDRYLRPRYSIAVLYIFELDRPADAIPHLLKYLEISTKDADAMFLLARAYYMTGNEDESLKYYERIIGITKDPKKRAEAENNRRIIMGQMYE